MLPGSSPTCRSASRGCRRTTSIPAPASRPTRASPSSPRRTHGTFNVKYGGSDDGAEPVISRRTPSWLTSTTFDMMPSTVDSSFGTTVRGERRAGRPSARPSATDSRNVSRVAGRGSHVASRGTSSILSCGSPTRITGRFGPSTFTSCVSVVFLDQRHVGDQRLDRARRQITRDGFERDHRHRLVACLCQPFEKRSALTGDGARDADSDRV